MDKYKSRVYTDRPDYADFEPPAKFAAIQSIIARRLMEHPKAICSYSGGSDSDIMIDLIERTRKAFELPPVDYVFFNTGLEMKATKDHVAATAEKYGVEIKTVRPRVIMLENVPEIQGWCPLGADNRPIKDRAGETFEAFVNALSRGLPKTHPAFAEMCDALGISPNSKMADALSDGLKYDVEYRVLRSCDYGAPTTRTRFYLIARSDGKPIVWPPPTHAPKDSEAVKNGNKLPYHTAAECIDWTIPAKSIFERDKPLAENTLRRIAKGIQKFVIDNPDPYIVSVRDNRIAPTLIQYHSEQHDGETRGQTLTEPIMTVDTNPRYALSCAYIMKNCAGGYTGAGSATDRPLDTVTAIDHNSVVTAHIMTMRRNMDGQRADEPLTTISCSGAHHAEVQAFLTKYDVAGAAEDPRAVVTIHGEKYIITDIKMRMLQPRELFCAQGFPADYIIDRDADGKPYPKSKQVARCGNAVTPPVPAALVRANLPEMCKKEVKI